MKSKPYLHNLDSSRARGFSLMEILVASSIGFGILMMSLSTIMASKRIFKQDITRTRIMQNLRGAIDVVSNDVREAGENLPANFPTIEITNGVNGASDELVIRRSLLDEQLKLCGSVSGTSIPIGSNPAPASGCGRNDPDSSYQAWSDYRSDNANFDAYIYDYTNKRGEFFKVSAVQDNGTQRHLIATESTWQYPYMLDTLGASFVSNASVYVLEEWRYRIRNGNLELIINNDEANAHIVSFNITDFQVSADLESGVLKTDFTKNDSWLDVKSINIEVTSKESYAGKEQEHKLSSKYFPRNILSH